MRLTSARAFTLLEVLVSLIILAVGLTAAITSTIEITRNSSYLKEKTLAHWVAQNVLAERELDTLAPRNKPLQGEMSMSDTTWRWQITLTDTPNPRIKAVNVTVKPGDGDFTLATVTGYEWYKEMP